MSLDEQYVIGVDVGGTNTDTAVLHGGRVSCLIPTIDNLCSHVPDPATEQPHY